MPIESKKIFIEEDEWKISRFLQMELEHEEFETAIESKQSTIQLVSTYGQGTTFTVRIPLVSSQ